MEKSLFAIAAFTIFFAACRKTEDLQTGALQQTETNELSSLSEKPKTPPTAINFTAPMLFPESMAYNPFTDQFLVSSIAQGTIGTVSKQGVYTPFIQYAALKQNKNPSEKYRGDLFSMDD